MFRPIRKKSNEISQEAAKEILKTAKRGVFAVNGDDGYPYAVPVNYFYDEESNRIWFHGMRGGHKGDALQASDKVCFTVIGEEKIKEEAWAPYVASTVVFGRCHICDDVETNVKLIKEMAMKYYPDESLADEEIALKGKVVKMYIIDIEHISGKEVQEK